MPPFDPATGDWLPAAPASPAQPVAPPPDAPRRGLGPTLWTILLGLDLALLGYLLLDTIVNLAAGRDVTVPVTRSLLWGQVAFNVVTLALVPFLWVAGTRVKPWRGAVRYLRLERPLRGLGEGVLLAFAVFAALYVLNVVLALLHYAPSNPEGDAIVAHATPALAVALSLSAGVGEELFFRGVMQRWLGLWGQAILFGLFHLAYGTPLQVIVPAALGLFLGWRVQRGTPLWAAMVAHFLFDFVQLGSKFLHVPGM